MSYMRSEARQRQILACAKRVFAERGFHAANISHICAAAGIGRGTLYQYFTNKRSVLTAILRDTLERVQALMKRQADIRFPPPERVTREAVIAFTVGQLHAVLTTAFDDDDTLRILLREAVGLDLDVEKLLGEIDEALIGIVEKSLIDAAAAGYLRPLDPRAVATLVVGGIEKLALSALRSDRTVDLARLAEEACRLHAIGTLSDRLKP